MKKWIVFGSILALSFSLAGCFNDTKSNEKKEETVKTVAVMRVQSKIADESLEYPGMIKSDIQKNLSFKISGRLKELNVNEGDFVEAGQILGVIDTQDLESQLAGINSKTGVAQKEIAKAEEAYTYTRNQYDDSKSLYELGTLSKYTLDSLSLAYEQAKLNYEIGQDQMDGLYTEKKRLIRMMDEGSITVDQNWIIDSIRFEESEFVPAGQPAFIVRSDSQMIVIYVTREDQKMLHLGQNIVFESDGVEKNGEITFIDQAADPQTSTYRVEIAFDDSESLNGSIVRVGIVVGESQGIWIPIQSIQATTIDFVYLIKEGRSSKRTIEILKVKGDEVLVAGLEEDEKLIVSGMKSLVEGMLVKAQE